MWRSGKSRALALAACLAAPLIAPAQDEPLEVFTESPRLLLRSQRLRLLRRERERQSMRWEHFRALIAGQAIMPEPGFAAALYYQVSGDEAAGRRAVDWALRESTDLRQLAFVFDWCRPLLNDSQTAALADKIAGGIAKIEREKRIPALRTRVLAAIAIHDLAPETTRKVLDDVVLKWWRGAVVPAVKRGRNPLPREDMYALLEMLHAIRDNTNVDLREAIPKYFQMLPAAQILSYYPATYPAPENEYRIPATRGGGEPDLRDAALSRAAEMAMVAYDTNAPDNQVLQGWIMHDAFLLRSTFGAPYEFLWANPYQPGLSYFHLPLVFHDEAFGRLFVRSSWDESAVWLGYFDGGMQMFQNGKITVLNPQFTAGPISLTSALVYFGKNVRKFQAFTQEGEHVFVLGLKPNQKYDVEIDDQELVEQTTDPGGILRLNVPRTVKTGVRLREALAGGIQSTP
jgi:hypothetical protein